MKTVLVYRSALLPASETFVRNQILALRRWKPLLIGNRLVADGLNLEGLDVRLLQAGSTRFHRRVGRVLNHLLGRPATGVVRGIKDAAGSIVHVHFGTDAVRIWPSIRALGLPMLVTLHGYDINIHRDWWESGRGGWLMRGYPSRLLSMSESPKVRFIAVSHAIRQRAIEFGLPAGKICVRHIGVDTKRFSPRGQPILDRERCVIFVGRLVEKKGCGILIGALSLMGANGMRVRLVVVGDGPQREELERQSKELGVAADFVGTQPASEIRTLYARARVFCLPSITAANGDAEGLPIAILEAQASGLPVVTSARGGATEGILDRQTGFAVSERDVEELADRLNQVLSNDELARSMSESGPRFIAERFDLGRCTRRLETLYDELAELHI